MTFKKATKKKMHGRLAICGPTGAGKTYTMLRVGAGMLPEGGTMAVIDSERRSASKYADKFDFDVFELESHDPRAYVKAIKAAGEAGYPVLGIDSLSHAWMGNGGALEQVDKIAKRMQSHNTFAAWRDVTPMHNELVDAILNYPGHVIVTMRSKMEYVIEKEGGTKTNVRKVGMAPQQREGIEYEFDVVVEMNLDNSMMVTKTRCSAFKELIINEPGEEFGKKFLDWLNAGKDPVAYAKEGAPKCTTVDQLSRLRREMEESGQFTGEAREILLARHSEILATIHKAELEAPVEAKAPEVTKPQESTATRAPDDAAATARTPGRLSAFGEMWKRRMLACGTTADFDQLQDEFNQVDELKGSIECRVLITNKGAELGIEGYEA